MTRLLYNPPYVYHGTDHRIWFTSDHHFGHNNIIKYCDRPFTSVQQMDDTMIDAWNGVVRPDDVVYHLGDFCLGAAEQAFNYWSKLNGHVKYLAMGWHHDKRWIHGLDDNLYSTLQNQPIEPLPPMVVLEFKIVNDFPLAMTLCHYPLTEWDRGHHGGYLLHGHSHGNLPVERMTGKYLDVGVDVANKLVGHYRPLSLSEVLGYAGA